MFLEGKEICFRYSGRDREILRNISLTVENSERVGIEAPSGYGKTTLCKILTGYMKPDAGQVLFDGKPIEQYRGYCPVQMIWQHPEQSVNPRLRMREVIREGDQVDQRILDGLGIETDWLNRFPAELSGGEVQRFCIARALGQRTKFLIADEISTMLDLITQSQIWNFLVEEVEMREIGMIIVSHSDALLEQVCTRRIKLSDDSPDRSIHHHG